MSVLVVLYIVPLDSVLNSDPAYTLYASMNKNCTIAVSL